MPDSHKNFSYSTVATAPSPATTGTSLVVAAGEGALLPTPPFNLTIWPSSGRPLSSNAEIVRVTGIATDTLTIVREQEGTTARTVVVGDQVAATITNKTLTDIEIVYNVKAYGATGDGVTEDATTVQAAIDAANTAGGGTVVFKKGTYKISTALTLYANIHVQFEPGAVIDATGIANDSSVLSAVGTDAAAVNLSANATRGDASVSVTAGAEAGFAAGDYVRIGSAANFAPTTAPNGAIDQLIGEIGQVLSTASGSVTLRWPLQDSYATADTAFLSKITMLENIRISGGRINGKGTGTTSVGILLDRCREVRIEGTRLYDFDLRAIRLIDVSHGTVDDVAIYGGVSASTQFYGVSVTGACQDVTVVNCFARDCRHAVSLGGAASRSGINRRISIVNFRAVDCTAAAYNSHAGSEDLLILGCSAIDCEAGIETRCPSVEAIGNRVIRPTGVGIEVKNQSTRATRFLVSKNRVEDTGSVGIYYRNPVDTELSGTAAGEAIRYVSINGNTLYNTAARAIYCQGTATWIHHSISIEGNVIDGGAQGTSQTIYLVKCQDSVVNDNVIWNIGTNVQAIRLENSTLIGVNGNLIVGSGAGSYGMRLINADECNFSGNTIRNTQLAIHLDANSINNQIGNNHLRDNTTGEVERLATSEPE